MKKILLVVFVFPAVLILFFAAVFFYRPSFIINVDNIKWILEKQSIIQKWSWDDAAFNITWSKWNARGLNGYFENFCLTLDHNSVFIDTCIEELRWDFDLIFTFSEGLRISQPSPLRLTTSKLYITTKDVAEEKAFEEIDVYSYWQMIWAPTIPNAEITLNNIKINESDESYKISAIKNKTELKLFFLDFQFNSNKNGFTFVAPKKFMIPMKPILGHRLHLYDFILNGVVQKEKIEFNLNGIFEVLDFRFSGKLDLPISKDPKLSPFRKDFLSSMDGKVSLANLNKTYKKYANSYYPILPAPFNVMEGDLVTDIEIRSGEGEEIVDIELNSIFNMKSNDQIVRIDLAGLIPFNVMSLEPGSVTLGVDFKELAIKLPRLSKASLPPQLKPDSRFIMANEVTPEANKKQTETIDLNLQLEAMNEKAFQLKTNLLDEILKANFQINIKQAELQDSFIEILPLKTTIFKRPIHLKTLKIDIKPPLETVIIGTVYFPLPEYKIRLDLEGPVSNPRYTFTSVPPLPTNDIYAVLLFGRPLADLDPDDKNAAQKTNQILSQGLLSLSVLYFLAGSPVEYIGYDAESNNAQASIGINSKTSLRVEGSGEGLNSTGLRRSLGKGWYIDTSVEKTQGSAQEAKSYGVMLERIIAY